MLPPAEVLRHLPAVELDEAARRQVVHGRAVEDPGAEGRAQGTEVALLAGGELVAVATEADGWLRPVVVLGTP
jgi:hypothetical protein